MRRLTTLKLLLNSSIFKHSLFVGCVLWGIVLVPVIFAAYLIIRSADIKSIEVQRVSIENVLTDVFESTSRYGDFVNARVSILEKGKSFGLSNVALCRDKIDILQTMDSRFCEKNLSEHFRQIKINNTDIRLQFYWQPPEVNQRKIILSALAIALGFSLVIIALTSIVTYLSIFSKIHEYSNKIVSTAATETTPSLVAVPELEPLTSSINSLRGKISQYHEENLKLKGASIMIEVSKQVSHDIRSPLSALSAIVNQITNVPENQRLILRSSINRISDIANTLLNKAKEQKVNNNSNSAATGSQANETLQLTVELLPAVVDSLVSEKRVQFREKMGVEIDVDLMQSYGAFVNINTTEFSRLVSNTINNAVESLPGATGRIVLSVIRLEKSVLLKITDNGKGIPKHILEKLGQMGVTHGKEGTEAGSGLGVYHAKKTIEQSFGGRFDIQTEEGKGTIILITLPEAPAPKWFVEKLILVPPTQVISLDDDQSIHGIYSERFQSLKIQDHNIEHFAFTSGTEFKEFYGKLPQSSKARLYLVDYELLNQKQSGLEIIEELGINGESILVTSRYEEPQIRRTCERLGVKLIPKGMASLIPLQIQMPKKTYHALLIDDDIAIIHSLWAMEAASKGKLFQAFGHPDEFFKAAIEFDSETPIYVDSNLGNGIKGEEVSKKIHAMGFTNIYLCTGYDPSDFPPMPWIKAVVPKEPQF